MNKKKNDATAYKQCECETLFAFVKDQTTNKIKIVVGNYKVCSKDFDNFDEAEKYVASKPYELIINAACLFMHFNNEENKKRNENKEV